jgi:Cys-rich protein (TIGR01571 family)
MSQFTEDLCGCFSDLTVCLWAWCVPGGICCVSASAVDKATGTGTALPYFLVCCLVSIGGALNRTKIREKYMIDGSFIMDLVFWCCVPVCAATQEYREVRRRG